MSHNNQELIEYLNQMVGKLENEDIDPEEQQNISEFYMLCKFKREFSQLKEEFKQEDLVKFLVLGWYFYCVLAPKNNKSF
jgi:hypothetical protein